MVALPLQWFPPIPVAGAQVSDFAFALAALVLLASRPAIGQLLRFDLVVLGLFIAGVVASAVANGGSYLKLAGHAELMVIAVVAALLARDEESAARLRLALVVAAVLAAVLGLAGAALYYAGQPTGLLNHYGDLVPGDYPRIRGTCVRANMLASVLATGGVILLAQPSRVLSRWVRAALIAVICLALLFTFSRTLLSFAVGVGAVLVARRPSRAGWVAWGLGAALVTGLLLISARYEILLDPTRPWEVSLSEAVATRWIYWRDALENVREHVLFGVGPGRAAAAAGRSAHLTWLNLWAVLGIVPLLAFAAIMARALLAFRGAIGAGIALVVILLDSLGRDVEDMRHVWILVGLLLAARVASRQTECHARGQEKAHIDSIVATLGLKEMTQGTLIRKLWVFLNKGT